MTTKTVTLFEHLAVKRTKLALRDHLVAHGVLYPYPADLLKLPYEELLGMHRDSHAEEADE